MKKRRGSHWKVCRSCFFSSDFGKKKIHKCVAVVYDFLPASLNLQLYIATEQHQELEHAIATLKSDKSHVENQLKILQQKNEIMVEMYQQKENALQQ